MKNLKMLFILSICCFKLSFSQNNSDYKKPNLYPQETVKTENSNKDFEVPEIKKNGGDIEGDEFRYLEKTYTILMEAKVDVFIPLEVISDINIETTIVGNQIKEIPFEVELNKTPDKKDFYSIKYSESVIDIDRDGKIDTYIHSPEYINEKIQKDNFVKIYGENISKEGRHNKTVYVTVEAGK